MPNPTPYYVVDAFADELFRGNPAGVCLLNAWPDESVMQHIAAENNLAETAFLVKTDAGYDLRWFTPKAEIDLCGHATLASAFVITSYIEPSLRTVHFQTQSGPLTVTREGDLLEMDFPTRMPKPIEITSIMREVIDVPVLEAHLSRDLVLVVGTEREVQELHPDIEAMLRLPHGLDVAVTARGDTADFVSRFFAPDIGIPEDSVTGSSHSSLIPFWSARLGRETMVAKQLSERGGTLYCRHMGDRVRIAGKAILYMRGEIYLGK